MSVFILFTDQFQKRVLRKVVVYENLSFGLVFYELKLHKVSEKLDIEKFKFKI